MLRSRNGIRTLQGVSVKRHGPVGRDVANDPRSGRRPDGGGRIRRHALDLLDDRERVAEALGLLQASYRPEDEPAVAAALRRVSRRGDAWHAVDGSVIDLLKPADRPVTT